MGVPINQVFPPTPTFVEHDIPDLAGKVAIITGATSGIGLETASILYSKNASVYIAARSSDKANWAITAIRKSPECAKSSGRLVFISLDLSNLSSIKNSADDFLEREGRLDVLIQNAGVMTPPAGSRTKLGHDLEMGTNCLGPFLFMSFLLPLLKRTAKTAPLDSVRVVWLSSMVSTSVVKGGIIFDEQTGGPKVLRNAMENHMQSKVGNLFIASEMSKRYGGHGVLSVSVNPGLMKTKLQRHCPAIQSVLMAILFKNPRYGAYSELFAALSPEVTAESNGAFIIPWGRFGSIPGHIEKGLSTSAGGTGAAERFWEWCEKETVPFQD